ncbi:MAG: transcription-repair coupling factor [Candidatus Omnitrophota bacterium]
MFKSIKIYIGQELSKDELLKQFVSFGYENVDFVCEEGDFSHRGAVIDIFPSSFEEPLRIEIDNDTIKAIRSFNIRTADSTTEHNIVIIIPSSGKRHKGLYHGIGEETPIESFLDLKKGDYIVHVNYGIGIYRGIIAEKKQKKDYVVIEYAGDDRLYVPAEEIHLLQKYISFYKRPPRLSKLGTRQWQRIKDRTKRAVASYAIELLDLQAARMKLKGFPFSKDSDWQKQLESEFEYEDTIDQTKASCEVKQDMEMPKPMDRLLCGDVGYGKTEVALRAAFKAVMDNKQVAILVPTTILAEQHYNTFVKRMKEFPVNVQMLSRFKTKKQQAAILKDLGEGKVDIIIGTHRLVSDDVRFKDLGLVIIDEEQRFGVRHKEKLKKLRLIVDVLTMTATPIPRTLYMSLMGARDMSTINTPPMNRLPIKTIEAEYSHELIKEAISRELARKGQVYFVNNRIKGIEKIAQNIQDIAGQEARIAVAHGRMPPKALESVMVKFINHQIDVLVSTTIIESGIDIPNANTLIVNHSDKFGLADLYQLRGRVGRFKRQAYAYFLTPKAFILSSDARRRLSAISKFIDLGSGFKIAMEDLQIRGAGNLLGAQQHGYVMAVGFDLYCRLLRAAIEEFKEKEATKKGFRKTIFYTDDRR